MKERGTKINNLARERGKKIFQVSDIRRSYRIRGRVARIQTNQNAIAEVKTKMRGVKLRGLAAGLIKIIDENRLKNKILVYSAIKIRAKFPALYSVLNPETSSLSPSAKSNGARFVSARQVINQIKEIGKKSSAASEVLFDKIIIRLKDLRINRKDNKVSAILTS